jgi:membrane carboxypeptidase/penicillin-binding protein
MFETKKISQSEYEAALKEDIKMRIRKTNEMKGGHFTDWIRQEMMKLVGVDEFLTNGFKVQTTLDYGLQLKAEAAIKEKIKELDKRQGFKGASRHLSSDEEIKSFISEQRKNILKEQSSYFVFSTAGKNEFEFHENDDSLEKNLAYFEEEKEKINERFKGHVEIGNASNDQFSTFLKVGNSYSGVVLKIDDLKRMILVEVGGSRIIIPESGFEWAHERKFSEEPIYYNPVKTPSKILKVGDVVLVNIQEKNISLDNLIHADLLVILTDQGGLFTSDPRQNTAATLLSDATAGDPALEKMAGGAASELSKGGMLTKVLAAKVAAQSGASTIIASGREPDVLTRLIKGEKLGTYLSPSAKI